MKASLIYSILAVHYFCKSRCQVNWAYQIVTWKGKLTHQKILSIQVYKLANYCYECVKFVQVPFLERGRLRTQTQIWWSITC